MTPISVGIAVSLCLLRMRPDGVTEDKTHSDYRIATWLA